MKSRSKKKSCSKKKCCSKKKSFSKKKCRSKQFGGNSSSIDRVQEPLQKKRSNEQEMLSKIFAMAEKRKEEIFWNSHCNRCSDINKIEVNITLPPAEKGMPEDDDWNDLKAKWDSAKNNSKDTIMEGAQELANWKNWCHQHSNKKCLMGEKPDWEKELNRKRYEADDKSKRPSNLKQLRHLSSRKRTNW